MKREPVILMLLLVGLGVWLVSGPDWEHPYPLRTGAYTVPVRIANERGVVEVHRDGDTGETTFRVLLRRGFSSQPLDAVRFRSLFGDDVFASATAERSNWLFRLLNITSWASLTWITIGLGGQVLFSGRMVVQWLISEKERRSVVPSAFWWMSLGGGLMLFSYFAWRQDLVGVLGQAPGIVIYARNIRLIYKQRRRDRANAAAASA